MLLGKSLEEYRWHEPVLSAQLRDLVAADIRDLVVANLRMSLANALSDPLRTGLGTLWEDQLDSEVPYVP